MAIQKPLPPEAQAVLDDLATYWPLMPGRFAPRWWWSRSRKDASGREWQRYLWRRGCALQDAYEQLTA